MHQQEQDSNDIFLDKDKFLTDSTSDEKPYFSNIKFAGNWHGKI